MLILRLKLKLNKEKNLESMFKLLEKGFAVVVGLGVFAFIPEVRNALSFHDLGVVQRLNHFAVFYHVRLCVFVIVVLA